MTTVRLATAGTNTQRQTTALKAPKAMTTVRFACVGAAQGETNGALAGKHVSTLRLAIANGGPERKGSKSQLAKQSHALKAPGKLKPALLVSFVYLKSFQAERAKGAYDMRNWVLDSGAFSAHMSGIEIKLQEYIDTAKRLLDSDSQLVEVFALDVIGDWKASLKNCEAMWKQGVEAIPCYHRGEPEDVLRGMARDYPKIALGGVARLKLQQKNAWAQQCFARVWPKAIHGFGFGSESSIMAMPFHSVDATNWELGPCAFGRWNAYGDMSVRGSGQDLRVEVDWYLKLEQRAMAKWSKALASLEPKKGAVK